MTGESTISVKKRKQQRSAIRRLGSNKPSSSKPRHSSLKSRFCCVCTDPSSSSGSSTPEKQSPLQTPDFIIHSPSSCNDTKTEGKIVEGETISVDSSGSRIKELENFGSTRKGRSRIMKTAKSLSDGDAANTTESSATDIEAQGKKGISQASLHSYEFSFDSSFNSRRKPSFRCSRVPKVKTVDKPTCSSTMRNSKFPENSALKLGKSESDILQGYKVCSYHHCSLHGHSHDSSTPAKRLDRRRKSMKLKKNIKQTKEINIDGKPGGSSNTSLSAQKEKQMSMWHLMRRHMSSALAAESKSKLPAPESSNLEADSFGEKMTSLDQGMKLRAVKLVRRAIEKILLPEVPDQSSDDLHITSDTASEQEPLEKNHSEVAEEMNTISTGSNDGQDTEKAKREAANESDRKAPKHWSNLKKWILLQRFIKELERVRKLNQRKARNLQLEPDPEAENVHLRHVNVEEKKRAEEWMLDYALQQAMSELALTQKRKVELLVKAFETMVPPHGDQHIQFTFPKLESNDEDCPLVTSEEDGYVPEADEAVCNADNLAAIESGQQADEFHGGYPNDGTSKAELEKPNYITMWHMVSQHVLSGIASNTGSALLGGEDDEADTGDADLDSSSDRKALNKDDAIKLVREAVNEILITQFQDPNLDLDDKNLKERDLGKEGKESGPDNPTENNETGEDSRAKDKPELHKSKNWNKLKKLLLLKRSIMALENARKIKVQQTQHLPLMPNPEPERVDPRRQMMDERKKAQQWMLDYAVQHIVTKLTPARKRRVAMLVEAFEAVVPFPENLSQ